MITKRLSHQRGHAELNWLKSFHTFSFGHYYDSNHMGFRSLRVINEDIIAPGKGFPTHGHKNMEIITIVLEGALEHKDSLGNQSIIKPGEVQKMSAGFGIQHSEFNHFHDKSTHLLQIWIEPSHMVASSYQQIDFTQTCKEKNLTLVCSPDGRNNSISIAQDAEIYMGHLKNNEIISYEIKNNRHLWIHCIDGILNINNQQIETGDALGVSNESELSIQTNSTARFLVFDLA